MTKPPDPGRHVLIAMVPAGTDEIQNPPKRPRKRQVCGCFVQMLRNPMYGGLVEHTRMFHPHTMPELARAQAGFMAGLARQFVAHHDPPWWSERAASDSHTQGETK